MDAVDKVDVVDEASEQTDGSWERKMVEIRMADGGGRMQVSAWVRGCWAIHPWGQHPRLCVLTHVPTGTSAVKEFGEALEAAAGGKSLRKVHKEIREAREALCDLEETVEREVKAEQEESWE